jgi:hypothetical protein
MASSSENGGIMTIKMASSSQRGGNLTIEMASCSEREAFLIVRKVPCSEREENQIKSETTEVTIPGMPAFTESAKEMLITNDIE